MNKNKIIKYFYIFIYFLCKQQDMDNVNIKITKINLNIVTILAINVIYLKLLC